VARQSGVLSRLGALRAVEEASIAHSFQVLIWPRRADQFAFVVDVTEGRTLSRQIRRQKRLGTGPHG
jgi:hypothetical protein